MARECAACESSQGRLRHRQQQYRQSPHTPAVELSLCVSVSHRLSLSLSLSLRQVGLAIAPAAAAAGRGACRLQGRVHGAVSPCTAGWPWVVPRLGEGQRTRSSLCWPPPERSVDAQLPSAQDVTPAAGIHHCRPHLGSGSLDAARLRRRLSGRRWGVMPQQPSSGRQRPSLH
eukprot:COSAG03_NODE_2175_length_3046_cov_168.311843_3_plen_173_part_00